MRVSSGMFKVEIDGLDFSEVKSVYGLQLSTDETSPYTGKTYNCILTIRRLFCDTDLVKWTSEVMAEQTEKRNGTIAYVDDNGEAIVSFRLENCWPVEWTAPEIQKQESWGGNDVGVETVALAVERVTLLS